MPNLYCDKKILSFAKNNKKYYMEHSIFISLSKDELQSIMANAIEQALIRQKEQTTPLITIQQASENLCVSVASIYNYIKKGKLHPIKLDGVSRLEVEEVNKLIKYSRV